MKTGRKNEMKQNHQVDRMLEDGLGAGLVVQAEDQQKFLPDKEEGKQIEKQFAAKSYKAKQANNVAHDESSDS